MFWWTAAYALLAVGGSGCWSCSKKLKGLCVSLSQQDLSRVPLSRASPQTTCPTTSSKYWPQSCAPADPSASLCVILCSQNWFWCADRCTTGSHSWSVITFNNLWSMLCHWSLLTSAAFMMMSRPADRWSMTPRFLDPRCFMPSSVDSNPNTLSDKVYQINI